MVTMKRASSVTLTLLTLVVLIAGSDTAQAQVKAGLGFKGWGIRGGVTVNPDQFHVGVHINAGTFAPKVRFQPYFDIGFGNDVTAGTINLDAHYLFKAKGWQPYVGGGIGIALYDTDRHFDVEAGLNLIAGFEWGTHRKLILEVRGGVGDIPDLKVSAGIGF
jgi:hypothetical protein